MTNTGFTSINAHQVSSLIQDTKKLISISTALKDYTIQHMRQNNNMNNALTQIMNGSETRDNTFKVYRKIFFPTEQLQIIFGSQIVQIIPMSTTLNYDLAISWIGDPSSNQTAIIYEFIVPYFGNFIPLSFSKSNLDKITSEEQKIMTDGFKLNQQQFEITLMPCFITPIQVTPLNTNHGFLGYNITASIQFIPYENVFETARQIFTKNTTVVGQENNEITYVF